MARITVRLTDRMSSQLEATAAEQGVTTSRFVRQLVSEAVAGTRVPHLEPPTQEELLELLAEKARQGNVSAIRSLLLREEDKDPQARALALFAEMASDRRQ